MLYKIVPNTRDTKYRNILGVFSFISLSKFGEFRRIFYGTGIGKNNSFMYELFGSVRTCFAMNIVTLGGEGNLHLSSIESYVFFYNN